MPGEANQNADMTGSDEAGNAVGRATDKSDGGAAAGTVSVTGTGSAEAAPDLMVVSIGVECRADSVAAAWSRAGTSSDAVASTFRRHGVADEDIRTSGLNVRADLVWREGEGQSVTGYVAASSLTVSLRTPGSASAAISEAVEAGGNDVRLDGLQLGFADAVAVMALARGAAWADARAAASQLAALAGAELGEVASVRQQPLPSAPIPVGGMQRAFATDALTVEAGESAVSASVTVAWELRPRSGMPPVPP
jgi:uncharacterized protein YggE